MGAYGLDVNGDLLGQLVGGSELSLGAHPGVEFDSERLAAEVTVEIEQMGLDLSGVAVKGRVGADADAGGDGRCVRSGVGGRREDVAGVDTVGGDQLVVRFDVGGWKAQRCAAAGAGHDVSDQRVGSGEAEGGAVHLALEDEAANHGTGDGDDFVVFDLEPHRLDDGGVEAEPRSQLLECFRRSFSMAPESEGGAFHDVQWTKSADDQVDEFFGFEGQKLGRAFCDHGDVDIVFGEQGELCLEGHEPLRLELGSEDGQGVGLEGEDDERGVFVGGKKRSLGEQLLMASVQAVEVSDQQDRFLEVGLVCVEPVYRLQISLSRRADASARSALKNKTGRGVWQSGAPVSAGWLTPIVEAFEIGLMSESPAEDRADQPIDVAVCVDHDALMRLRPVIRHLCVGLVDFSARIRLLASSPEAASLASLGPIQLLTHEELVWPFRRQRFRKILDFLSPKPPSIIYAISSGAYGLGVRLAEAFDVDLVVQVTSSRDVDALDGLPPGGVAHFVAASEPLLDLIQQRNGTVEQKATLIRPGVIRGRELTCFTEENRIPSMVCTAALDAGNRIEMIIAAAEIIRDHGHPLASFFLGDGGREAALRKLVRERKLSANITFARPTADPMEILRGSDIFLLSPGEEDISARPLQAMASGTAVVAFEGGVADYLHENQTAVICGERSAAALAEGIEALLLDHEFARRLATEAREYVTRHHPMSAMAEQTISVLRQVVLRRQTFRLHK